MSSTKHERRQVGPALRATRVVAILRASRGDRLAGVCDALLGAGVRCLEITTNTPSGLDAVRRVLAGADSGVEVGVGTVRTPAQVDQAADAGASFVVAPGTNPAVGERAAELGLAWYPGAFTPTEIHAAWSAGASAVKLFPGGALGPGYLKAVRAPLPDIPLVPTGGVEIGAVGAWLDAGAVAVGLGGPLIGDALAPDADLDALAERARMVCAAVGARVR